MKLQLPSLTCLAVILISVFACSKNDKKTKGEIGEPNNTIMEAGIIESGKPYSMKIDSVGDIDWYALPVKDSGYVRVSTKTVPDNLKLNIRFAEKEEWKSEKEKWLTKWLNIPSTIAVSGIDTLYFAIIDDYNDAFSDEAFEFKADFIQEFDKYEPNDEPDLAHEIKSGEIIHSAFFPNTDQDWFKISVDSTGYLMLRARKVPDGININARYAWKESEFDEVKYLGKWQNLPAALQVTKPGTYYVVLIDDYNDAMSEDPAEWKIDFIPEMDFNEPNNSFEEAHQIAIGDTIEGKIFPVGDVDFYKFHSNKPQTIQLTGKSPSEITLNVRLHIQEEMGTETVGKWQKLPVKLDLQGDKNYFIEVIDDYNDAYSVESYTIFMQKYTE